MTGADGGEGGVDEAATDSAAPALPVPPLDEEARLRAVRRYDVLDTPPDGAFDRVARLAARFFDVPIATVSIVDRDRIWFKATHGVDVDEVGRDPGLCASAILQNDPYIITNAIEDPRSLENPLVRGELGVRFYAAAPIRTADGHNLGTVNVISGEPRSVTPREEATLRDLADVVVDELEVRLTALRTVADLNQVAKDELSDRLAQQEAVAELSSLALQVDDLDELFEQAVRTVGSVLGLPLVKILEREGDDATFLLRAGIGWRGGAVGDTRVRGPGQAAYTLASGMAVLVTDSATEQRFPFATLLADHGVRCGMSAPIRTPRRSYGVIGAHATEPRVFTDDEFLLVQAVAGILGSAIGRVEAETELREQALRDPLTELANRTLLLDRTQNALAKLPRSGETVAVLFLDLDNFKPVNDRYGHETGDVILSQLASRLRGVVRPTDTLARFGGDEFVILCEGLDDDEEATSIAARVLETMIEPYDLGGRLLQMTASVGVATATEAIDAAELLRAADIAMYRAKERGRARIEVFDNDLQERAERHLEVQLDLQDALARDELRLVYQPQVAVDGWRITGAEALLRWQHPTRGLLEPSDFLAVAEKTGLVGPIGAWVRSAAIRQLATWDRQGTHLAQLALNLSAGDLADPGLTDELTELLAANHIDPRRLGVEVTETAIVRDTTAASDTLEALSQLGVTVALDDFGTGYSSLRHLHELPVDTVKVDRTFIACLDREPGRPPLVAGTLALLRSMGLNAVAEGVETLGQLHALEQLGCPTIQGYLFSRPLSADEIAPLLANGVIVPEATPPTARPHDDGPRGRRPRPR